MYLRANGRRLGLQSKNDNPKVEPVPSRFLSRKMRQTAQKGDKMQATNTFRRIGIYPYGLVVLLILASAMVGAVGGYSFRMPVPAAPAAAASQPIAKAQPVPVTGTSAFLDDNVLRQEHRELLQAQRKYAAELSASSSASVVIGEQNQLRQEMRDLRQMQKSSALVPATAPAPYPGLTARQISRLENLP